MSPCPKIAATIHFTNPQMKSIHLMYGVVDGKGRNTARIYAEWYPIRKISKCQSICPATFVNTEHSASAGIMKSADYVIILVAVNISEKCRKDTPIHAPPL
ncbi:hypothetical protein AVEN_129203-1 [Araneus ventricosus]|uniref:Uncharacterized protein n=1 Tax=Araneus ventricosus TaxID=182803 RepID=A0A4Y2T8T9_ARAVE|nr:hypothetical protein AVEN_129203-1 [Araneus ventricosus]